MPKSLASYSGQNYGRGLGKSLPKSEPKKHKAKRKVKLTDREKARRIIVIFTFIIYWLLIFEGALRKWVLPNAQEWLFFARDPFALGIYYLAWKNDMWPKWTPIFKVGMSLAIISLPLAMVQIVASGLHPLTAIYGWRMYFWYLPLAFIIGEQFHGKDLRTLVKHSLIVCVPIALLVLAQFRSSADSFINSSLGGSQAMLVAHGVVRTSGTFTVAAAQTLFIGSVIAFLLTAWLLPKKQRPFNNITLLIASGAVLSTFAVSGSRSVFFQGALVLLGALGSAIVIFQRKPRVKVLLILPALVLAAGLSYVTVFSSAFEVMKTRQHDAEGAEGMITNRLFNMLTAVFKVMPSASVLGLGIGAGTMGGARLATGSPVFSLAEDEWSRILLECGLFGVCYIFYRFWLIGWLIRNAITAVKRTMNPLPLVLVSFIGITIFQGQISLQGTINGYGWLFVGFCIAANRLGIHGKNKEDGVWS